MSENESAQKAQKNTRVVVNQQQIDGQLVPHSTSGDAHNHDGEEHEETPAVVNKLTECVEFDRDAEVRSAYHCVALSALFEYTLGRCVLIMLLMPLCVRMLCGC